MYAQLGKHKDNIKQTKKMNLARAGSMPGPKSGRGLHPARAVPSSEPQRSHIVMAESMETIESSVHLAGV